MANDNARDPLDLEKVDRDIRINELKERVKAAGGGSFHISEDCPPELHEQFLENVLAYESAPVSTPFERLTREQVALPRPEALDDAALHTALWNVIRALADRNVFLYHTNHLSDRELYEHLWHEGLHEAGPVTGKNSGWQYHLDLIGSGSQEHIQLGLRYYDTEEQRRRWARDFPKHVIPPHEDPPYDRDRDLPVAPPPPMMKFGMDEEEDEE